MRRIYYVAALSVYTLLPRLSIPAPRPHTHWALNSTPQKTQEHNPPQTTEQKQQKQQQIHPPAALTRMSWCSLSMSAS